MSRAMPEPHLHEAPAAQPGDVLPTVVLQPMAAPSILGLFGFFGATLMVAANLAGWYGNPMITPGYLFPFALFFGGLAQFLAGMWAYKARDGVATAMHGTWGSFWLAYGVLQVLFLTHVLSPTSPAFDQAFTWWWIVLAAVTWMGALASISESIGVFGVLSTLAAGSTLAAIGFGIPSVGVQHAASWVFVISAAIAWYVASAMMIAWAAGRTILPTGKLSRAANIPGRRAAFPIQYEWAEPGVRMGQ